MLVLVRVEVHHRLVPRSPLAAVVVVRIIRMLSAGQHLHPVFLVLGQTAVVAAGQVKHQKIYL
jgi:hypothetical protein